MVYSSLILKYIRLSQPCKIRSTIFALELLSIRVGKSLQILRRPNVLFIGKTALDFGHGIRWLLIRRDEIKS